MGALVLLSGGQDSTVCLFWAKHYVQGEIRAIGINYGQRHVKELEAARHIADMAGVLYEEIQLSRGILEGTSPLVNAETPLGEYTQVADLPKGIEPTFVPGRNLLFLVIAANRAACWGLSGIVIGVTAADEEGYPDCRPAFFDYMEPAIQLGIRNGLLIHTPLQQRDKQGIVHIARELPGCMDALAYSHTCYAGEFPPCGKCHACLLRAEGFAREGISDPLVDRAYAEWCGSDPDGNPSSEG